MIAKLLPFRRVSVVLICLSLLGGLFWVLPAQAATRTGHDYTYYDDAAHDNVVGFYVWCNSGYNSSWGRITPYVVVDPDPC